ncbi:MAG: sigma-70 family RNA polymerase sigma factor [Planctomycetes bacterium]|nr:sigma-70 family RNA polymerase sigma factor [Planctomycetota bacterium]
MKEEEYMSNGFCPDSIVAKVRDGDIGAYEYIIKAYDDDVRMVLGAILPDNSMVEDGAQETFITAYHKLEDYAAGTNMQAWIKEIARNTGRNMRRKWLQQNRLKCSYHEHIRIELGDMIEEKVEAISSDVSESLQDCIRRLQENTRLVVNLYYEKGNECAQIAESLNRTTSWVKVTLYRARLSLAQCMEAKGII